jgi:hypothetical protein
MINISRNFYHNQRTFAPKHVLARKNSVWFAPAGITYMKLPVNKGVRNPRTADITYLVAETPTPGSSNPRTFNKRHKFSGRHQTSIWY